MLECGEGIKKNHLESLINEIIIVSDSKSHGSIKIRVIFWGITKDEKKKIVDSGVIDS